MSVKRKIIVKTGKKTKQLINKIKERRASINSTDNMSNTGPVDKAIKKVEFINKENKHFAKNMQKGNVYKVPGFKPMSSNVFNKAVTKGETLLGKLKWKQLHKKMGIK